MLVALYAGVLVATTLAMPLRVLVTGDAQYAGDWSIAAAPPRHVPHDLDEDYDVDFRLSNCGQKAIKGPSDLIVYLVSEDGTRYDAASQPDSPPFDALCSPGNRS